MVSSTGHGMDVWSSAAWRQLAVSWLDEQLSAAGSRRVGDVEQPHLRPWATVLKVPTTSGTVWFKACGPATAFEAGLYQFVGSVAPEQVLSPIATDPARGWIILPDGGPPLGDRIAGAELADAMETAMAGYGHFQRTLARHVDHLLSLGITDMRPAILPTRFEEALQAVGQHISARGDAADRTAYERVLGLGETVVSWCGELAAGGGQHSLDHNDLHPWNILFSRTDGTGAMKFYDWGDSVVAHPFASMLVPLGYMKDHLGVSLDHPRVLRIRDAYLDAFSDLGSHAELVGTLQLACRAGKIARALTWDRSLRAQGYDQAGEFARAPLKCLVSLLDESYVGGA
jgi:phosphotransferase family enzyme